jgi:hypothetical protein
MEYFRMEMLYVSKLKARRSVLGVGAVNETGSSKEGLKLPRLEGEHGDHDVDDTPVDARESFLSGAIPKLVAKQAISG